jgi:hypothetical protein
MGTLFDLLPDSSRIWIYQSNRKLSDLEITEICGKANIFVKTWSAHENDLQAGAVILHKMFLILSVNEDINRASGCSIDKSVKFIQQMENTYNISLLDRSKFTYFKDQEILISSVSELKMKIDTGSITKDTLIFNNLVDKKGDLGDKWIIRARESWMKKYLMSN